MVAGSGCRESARWRHRSATRRPTAPQASAGAHRRRGAAAADARARPREQLSARLARARTGLRRNRSVRRAVRVARAASMSGSAWTSVASKSRTTGSVRNRRRSRATGRACALTIGFVGTMAWHKGAHVLIEAARRLRGSFEVVIAGDPNVGPEYHARLKRAAAGLPVRFEGPFDSRAMSRGSMAVWTCWSCRPCGPRTRPSSSTKPSCTSCRRRLPAGRHSRSRRRRRERLTYEAFSPEALALALQRFLDEPGLAESLASRAPAVKTIAEDAHEWEARYETLLSARASCQRMSRTVDVAVVIPTLNGGSRLDASARGHLQTGRTVSTVGGRRGFRIDRWHDRPPARDTALGSSLSRRASSITARRATWRFDPLIPTSLC